MIEKAHAADVAAGAVAGASGAASIVTAVGDVAVQILGVPLPVVLAAVAGAALARAYVEPVGLAKAFFRVVAWVVLGCTLAPIAHAIASKLLGVPLSTNAFAGMAAIVASAEAWPLLLDFLRDKFPGLSRWLGEKKGGGDERH